MVILLVTINAAGSFEPLGVTSVVFFDRVFWPVVEVIFFNFNGVVLNGCLERINIE